MKAVLEALRGTSGDVFAVDTTLVLFFLAMDLGQSVLSPDFGSAVSGVTLLAVIILPYLSSEAEKSGILRWIGPRFLLSAFGLVLGILFGQAVGVVLPENLRLLPLTLLLAAAFVSFGLQFYGILRVRLAR